MLTEEFKAEFRELLAWIFSNKVQFLLSCMGIRKDGQVQFDDETGIMSFPMFAHREIVDYLSESGFQVTNIAPFVYWVSIVSE